MLLLLTEKPSAARNFAKALGGMQGSYHGVQYNIVSARGHLMELLEPKLQVPEHLADQYRVWDMSNLPWNLNDFAWKKAIVQTSGIPQVYQDIERALEQADAVCIATDNDPSGEGSLLGWEILQACGWNGETSRMYFADESPKSIQTAFDERKPLSPDPFQDGDFVKADTRQKWDFLSMQFSRIATCTLGEKGYRRVLRNGRLKSVMVSLVGEQEDLINDYKKVPFYEVRFKDENGNIFAVNKDDAIRELDRSRIDLDKFHDSKIVVDSKRKKRTSPGKLLDLAGMSAILASKGFKPDRILAVYQTMYENQIVSYPRTEDKKITTEQFNELLPHIDKIASLVGADKTLLTHRVPRRTHVDDKAGAHGANRPGTNVPASLEELNKYGPEAPEIYMVLAKNYLAMLAEDYQYVQEKGHLEDYPDYIGIANIPTNSGYKAVFDSNADDEGEVNVKNLGESASPFVHEGANKRPQKPTMKWLEKRLEKYNVGTGATRTSTIAEVTRKDELRGLMNEKKGVLSLTENGKMNYCLIKGCNIASPEMTEKLFNSMERIGKFQEKPDKVLNDVSKLVMADYTTMQANKVEFEKRFGTGKETKGPVERKYGCYKETGELIAFKRSWGNYKFQEAELEKLLEGEEITIDYPYENGRTSKITGKLAQDTYKGQTYWGFKPNENQPDDKVSGIYMLTGQEVTFRGTWSGHEFTKEEIEKLLNGETIEFRYTKKNGWMTRAVGRLEEFTYNDNKYWGFRLQ